MGDADLIQVLERRFVTELKGLVGLVLLWRRGGLEQTPHARRYARQLARERIAAGGILLHRLAALGREVEDEMQTLAGLAAHIWGEPDAKTGYGPSSHVPGPPFAAQRAL